jgi:2-phosphoglycerate kinase
MTNLAELYNPEQLPARLRYVRWIGGGSGAGKSTVARQLAADHGLDFYSSDDTIAEHVRRLNPLDAPLLHAFLAMEMDERWANRSPDVMCRTFPWFAGEGFELIVEDLLALPEDPPILAEGFRLLPRLVAPLLSHTDQAIWLVPTPDFRRAAFDARGFTWEIPRKTSKPERALSNLLIRDQLFSEEVVKQATALQLRVIEVDGAVRVNEVTKRVADHLGLSAR